MKKFFIIAMAAVLCFAFTVPAMAKVRVNGFITGDFAYENRSSEMQAGGVLQGATTAIDDFSTVRFSSPRTLNRLGARYSNDDNSVIGIIELRGGSNQTNDTDVHWNYAYIMWRLNPIFRLQIGRQTQTFSIHAPGGGVGWQNNFQALLNGFGNMHGGSTRNAIKALVKFTDQVRLEVQLLDPDTDNDGITVPAVAAVGGNAVEENTIPRFDVSLPVNLGAFAFEPSFTWLTQEYDQVAAGSDDSFDIWGFSLWGKAGFGPITLQGEFSWGENLGNGNYVGAMRGGVGTFVDTAGNTKAVDTELFGFWVKGSYNFGPATLNAAYGMAFSENDGNPNLALAADGGEWDVTTWGLIVNLDIKAAKGFTVTPEVAYYNLDDDADIGGNAGCGGNCTTDFGNRTVVGVRFLLRF
jgi:hypothetical protein